MKIYTLWQHEERDNTTMPWCIGAEDEYTVDNNGGHTPEYCALRDKSTLGFPVRELIIEVPDSAVMKLFRPPTVKASVVEE